MQNMQVLEVTQGGVVNIMSSYPIGRTIIAREGRVVGCQKGGEVARLCDSGIECVMHCLLGGKATSAAQGFVDIYTSYKIANE